MKRRRRRRDGNEEGVFRILGQKIDYNTAPIKIIAPCLHLPPYFRARVIRWCYLSFSPADSRCHGNEFWDKIDYNSAFAKANCTLFSPTDLPPIFGPGLCNGVM